MLAEQLKDLSLLGLDFSLEVHQELDAHCPRQGKVYAVVLHPFRRSFRNRMASRFEMGHAILAMGTAAGGCALRRSVNYLGRSRSTSPGGNGLRKLRRGRHRGNRDGWNGPFGESTNAGRTCSLALILLGLIGLKFFSDATE